MRRVKRLLMERCPVIGTKTLTLGENEKIVLQKALEECLESGEERNFPIPDAIFPDTPRSLLTKEYGYSPEHAWRILSGRTSPARHVAAGLERYFKISNIIKNLLSMGYEGVVKEFLRICESTRGIENPTDIAKKLSVRLEPRKISMRGIKKALGTSPSAPMDSGKRSLKRMAVSTRLHLCHEILKKLALEAVLKKEKE